ncbi:MAG TPA: VOC family protein [Candidatus Limnocylindrales bacterium]|jgi:catechol 2,3-dioxygenase-like lactoylglutathione lyase family enzyme
MLTHSPLYASIAVEDLDQAKAFYAHTLGLRVIDLGPMLASVNATNGYAVLMYGKPGHVPAQHTILNFPVDDIEAAVDELTAKGVTFEHYPSGPIATNEKGIAHPGPWQAWFRDPSGNIVSVIQD